MDFARFRGVVHDAEGYFLTVIQWGFINDYPFSHLNFWLAAIRTKLTEHQPSGAGEAALGPFRKMRSAAIHVLSMFLVVWDEDPLDNETLAAVALTAGLRVCPLSGFSPDEWHVALGVDLEPFVGELADRVPEMEEQLRPFS
jgi:hypothetical protein